MTSFQASVFYNLLMLLLFFRRTLLAYILRFIFEFLLLFSARFLFFFSFLSSGKTGRASVGNARLRERFY